MNTFTKKTAIQLAKSSLKKEIAEQKTAIERIKNLLRNEESRLRSKEDRLAEIENMGSEPSLEDILNAL